MNVTFKTMNSPAYRTSVPAQRKRTPQSGMTKAADYDTVDIKRTRAAQDDDESFARLLARKVTAQIGGGGASPERVQELGRRIADGTYQPDAQRIAGRMLGLS